MQNKGLFKILVIFMGVLLIPSSASALLSNATTVGYYTMEESGSPYASSVSSADLTGGNAPAQAGGIIGFGGQFDGSNECISGTHAIYTALADEFAISFWMKGVIEGNQYAAAVSRGTWGGGAIGIRSDSSGNPGQMKFEAYSTSPNSIGTAETTLNDNAWHHIVSVIDNGDRYIYVDGALSDDNTYTGTNPTAALVFAIGCRGGSDRFMSAIIDEIAIFNASLTAANVTYLYNGGVPGVAQQYPYPPPPPNASTTNETSNIVGAPPGFVYNLTYNATSKIVNYEWSDQYFTMNNVRLDIRYLGDNQYVLNTSTEDTNNPGSINANITALVDQNFTVRALAYLTDLNRTFLIGNTTLINQLWIYPEPVIDYTTFTIDEPEGVFWGMMIVGTMIIMATFNPAVAITSGVVGLFFTALFGFIELATEYLFLIALLAGILIWGMKK